MPDKDNKKPVTSDDQDALGRASAQIKIDFRQTFGPQYGKNVLAYLAAKYNVFSAHLTTDPVLMAVQEGQRSVVVDIITILSEGDPEDYRQTILKEVIYG